MNKFVAKYGQILLPLITPYDDNEDVIITIWLNTLDIILIVPAILSIPNTIPIPPTRIHVYALDL